MEKQIDLIVKHGIPVVSSRTVADVFEKEHEDVLKSIDTLIRAAKNLVDLNVWFIESREMDSRGRAQKIYYMTRGGFSLLAMEFTGKKAMQLKAAFIERFKEKEF